MIKRIFNLVAFAICLVLGTCVALDKLDLFVGIVTFIATAGITVFFNHQYEFDKPLYRKRKGDVQLINLLANPHYIDFHANSSFNKYHQQFIGLVFGYAHPKGTGQEEVRLFKESGFQPIESLLFTKDEHGLVTAGRVIASDRYVDNGIGYIYRKGEEDEQALLNYKANAPMILGKQLFFLQEMLDNDEEITQSKIDTTKALMAEYRERLEKLDTLEKPLDIPAYVTLRVYFKEPLTPEELDGIIGRVYIFTKHVNNGFQVLDIVTD